MLESVPPMFSSRSFMISGLTLWSLIHFELFFKSSIYLFIFGCAGSSLLHFLWLWCVGFSLRCLLLLIMALGRSLLWLQCVSSRAESVVAVQGFVAHSMCSLPRAEIEPMSALARWFLIVGGCVLVAQSCQTLCYSMDCSPQAPLSMVFSRQEYWSGLPFTSPEELPNPGIEPWSPASQANSLLFELQEPLGKSEFYFYVWC